MIYLDHSATYLTRPPEVMDAVVEAMQTFGNSARGGHSAAMNSSRAIYAARTKLSEFFNGYGPEYTIFTANATEALNMVIKGILNPGDRVVTTVMEHNSVLRPLYEMEKQGVELQILPADDKGRLDMEAFYEALNRDVRMVICTHGSNVTGNVNDIRTMGQCCREHGVLFAVDAAQTAGLLPIDMQKDGIDLLCFTGHKSLMGPQGTGGLCIRPGVKIRPLVTGGSGIRTFDLEHPAAYPEALEAGTLNGHGIAGLSAGVDFIRNRGMELIYEKAVSLSRLFYNEVSKIPGICCYGDFSEGVRLPVVSLNVEGEDSAVVSDWLAVEYDICTRPGGHCAPLIHQHFHTEHQGMVRFSFSYMNSKEEVYKVVEALQSFDEM